MFISENLGINESGNLTIGKSDAVELARKYGTPLYVMDEELIRKKCREYKNAMDKYYGGNGMILYASKAFCCKYMYNILNSEGLGADVVSGGELYTALKAGFPAKKLYFHGNNKTEQELESAVLADIGRIVVDNLSELELLNSVCERHNKKAKILFRIKPGIDAHTHDFVKTGQIDSKFGVALENGEAFEICKKTKEYKNVEFVGIHCHIGSQIFDIEPFVLAARVMTEFAKKLKDELGLIVKELNLGGGFGIRYVEEDKHESYDAFIKAVSDELKKACAENNLEMPFVLMEPGRSIVALAGTTLYTVGNVKEIEGYRTYVSVDGGMFDNPRYALYKAQYTALVANKASQEKTKVYTLAGKCCESGDLIGEDMPMQEAEKGDIIAVLATGAYNYSMASHYNRNPKPPVIMVNNGEEKIAVKRESYEDLLKNDL
ncbi:MAG: diaminopimelate decarboxylase [Ruminococcaceae bacterium]|nr:diaminopimelate decarboxylase [Oscillospiraceae bacterium]